MVQFLKLKFLNTDIIAQYHLNVIFSVIRFYTNFTFSINFHITVALSSDLDVKCTLGPVWNETGYNKYIVTSRFLCIAIINSYANKTGFE